jgi:GDPmannose 4,6-dehydratase
MRAFITGITGQDGSYLAEYLLGLGYDVYGIVRRHSVAENQMDRIEHIKKDIHVSYGDLSDQSSIERAVREAQPDEIYNLAAQSHVRISFDIPQYTAQINAVGLLNMLEIYKRIVPGAKFYQASSSEMFGLSVDADGYQRETTPMNPVSPYGCAKVFGYNMVRHYRRAYRLDACNGILFNHESPRRGSNFVTRKIIKAACMIKAGKQDGLVLGNMDSHRDWGHSKDYVRAMHMIINQPADDFVVSSMQTHTIRDMCDIVFGYLGMDYRDHVTQDKRYMRPEELPYLRGDSSRIRALGWKPEYTFEDILHEMIDDQCNRAI